LSAFSKLHSLQAHTQFIGVDKPPFDFGIT
jgi:hypothetical protein